MPESMGDPALMKQVWLNLLSNALKYSRKREPSVIQIGCEPRQGRDVFFVKDNGTALTCSMRISSSEYSNGSTGLTNTKDGRGPSDRPACDPQAWRRGLGGCCGGPRATFFLHSAEHTMNDQQPIELLIVEDSPQDLELALRALRKSNLTNAIHVARDGAEALEFLFCEGAYSGRVPGNGPKLILLDLKLPKIDGLEVLPAREE